MEFEVLAAMPSDEIADAIEQLQAARMATHAAMLELILVYDDNESWKAEGAPSMAAWLTLRLGIPPKQAHDWLEAARALVELPAIRSAFNEGTLCWQSVKALVEVATPESETELLKQAEGLAAPQIEAMVRNLRPVPDSSAKEALERRFLNFRSDRRTGCMRLSGLLSADDGAVVQKAIELIAEDAPRDPVDGSYELPQRRYADALVEMASTHLGEQADSDRAMVVVHVDAETLKGREGGADLGGIQIPGITARRLVCDSDIQVYIDGPDGQPIGIGRKSRQIPAWMVRQLRHRDDGCRFPGCLRTRWLKFHHIEWWSKGGRTDRENLISVCGHHHKLMHEGGWRLRGSPSGKVEFFDAQGRVARPGAPALRPEVRKRLPGGLFPDSGLDPA